LRSLLFPNTIKDFCKAKSFTSNKSNSKTLDEFKTVSFLKKMDILEQLYQKYYYYKFLIKSVFYTKDQGTRSPCPFADINSSFCLS